MSSIIMMIADGVVQRQMGIGNLNCVNTYVLIRLPKPETDRVPRLAWRAGAVVDGRVVAHAAGRVGAFLRERQLGRARRTGARVCHLEWCRSAGRGARLGHRAWMAFWARRGWLCDGQLRRPARLGWLGRLVKVFDEETAGCACCSLGGRGGCLLGRRGRVVVCEGRAGGGAARARVCRGGWVAQLVEECGHGGWGGGGSGKWEEMGDGTCRIARGDGVRRHVTASWVMVCTGLWARHGTAAATRKMHRVYCVENIRGIVTRLLIVAALLVSQRSARSFLGVRCVALGCLRLLGARQPGRGGIHCKNKMRRREEKRAMEICCWFDARSDMAALFRLDLSSGFSLSSPSHLVSPHPHPAQWQSSSSKYTQTKRPR